MNIEAILENVVKTIRSIPAKLSGDDSPLGDPWEEIKDQAQHEMSFSWPAYLETMKGIIEGTVDSLSQDDRTFIAAEMNVPPDNLERLRQGILKRLIAKAKREKIRYAPFHFEYFRYSLEDMTVYAEVLQRTGLFTCEIMAYSGAAPSGERGEVNTDIIEATMPADEFEQARQRHWPDSWERSRTTPPTAQRPAAEFTGDQGRHQPSAMMNDSTISVSGCDHCCPPSADAAWAARARLKHTAELIDESHYHVTMLACQQCGQQFLSVFTEMIDWSAGDDAQYWTLMPVTEGEAADLARRGHELTEAEIGSLGVGRQSLFRDYPSGKEPSVHWGTGTAVGPHD